MSSVHTNEVNTVRECVEHIAAGTLTSESLTQQCLNTIDQTDKDIAAWATLDADIALEKARALDQTRKRGEPIGALHGIPVGVKDIFDTKDLPTEKGTDIYAGRQPESNCAVVNKLQEAGAFVMGKTVSTEFAFMHPSKTHNPYNLDYSPGGSSSGSAAAVAAGHVPLAVGSQTNGSVIRPASFCGVYGYKPSYGIISRSGALATSATLDQVGLFARDIGDMALFADALAGYDATDSGTYTEPKPAMLQGYLSESPVPPTIAWLDMPYADRYSNDVSEGFDELLAELGNTVERVPAPQSFAALLSCHKVIHEYEIVRCLEPEITNHWDSISDTIKPTLSAAKKHSDEIYNEALEIKAASQDWFAQFFNDYDAIITPSAVSEAPLMGSTGDPVCCTIWTLCGLPCISMPLLTGSNDLPVGVQLVGAFRQDDRLFRTARSLINQLHDS